MPGGVPAIGLVADRLISIVSRLALGEFLGELLMACNSATRARMLPFAANRISENRHRYPHWSIRLVMASSVRNVNALFRFLWRPRPLLGAALAESAASALTGMAAIYRDSRHGDVAEWLKAAVC
jgi:hypothetical protein